MADGTAKSHAMSLAYDKYCLTELDPPLVLQEFVNHGTYVLSPFFFPLTAGCCFMSLKLRIFWSHVVIYVFLISFRLSLLMFCSVNKLGFFTIFLYWSCMRLSLVKPKLDLLVMSGLRLKLQKTRLHFGRSAQ